MGKAVQFIQLVRSSKREKRLGTVILFVTSRCNALCQTCFYHAELNQPGDMTFAQIEKISRTMPPITDLWLSGGEPTLRRDLEELVSAVSKAIHVKYITMITHGGMLTPDRAWSWSATGYGPGASAATPGSSDGRSALTANRRRSSASRRRAWMARGPRTSGCPRGSIRRIRRRATSAGMRSDG